MNYDEPMWQRLQALKIRCLEHMGQSNATDFDWWAHYLKLTKLQESL